MVSRFGFNQEKALVGAFSVITNVRMDLFEALSDSLVALYYVSTQSPPTFIFNTHNNPIKLLMETVKT